MGLNTMAIVADSVLSDEQLEELRIAPAGAAMTAEDALLRSQPEHVCVVRAATYTAVAGYADALAAAVESDRLALPGTVVAVSSVSSVDFVDFRVFVDGGLRRHLCTGDDGSANVGQPLRIRGAGRGARGRGGWRHSHRPGARDRGRRQ